MKPTVKAPHIPSLALRLYFRLMPVQLLSLLTVSLCATLNTVIINQTLGGVGLSQIKIVDAVTNIVTMFTLLLTNGEVLLIGKAVCRGEKSITDRYFSTAINLALLFGTAVCLVGFVFAQPVCAFFGADEEILPACCRALRGSLVSYFALPLCSVLLSLFQIRSDLKTPIAASVLYFVLNLSMNAILLGVLKKDVFYAGFSASLAQSVVLLFLLIRMRRTKFARFSVRNTAAPEAKQLFCVGLTETASVIWSSVKFSFMIKLLADVGGIAGLTDFSVISSVDSVTYGLFHSGYTMVTMMIAGIYINEGDRDSLRRFAKVAILLSYAIALVLFFIMFFSSYPMAVLYGLEDTAGHLTAQRVYSFAYLFFLPYSVLVTLFAALDKKKLVNILSFFTGLVIPMIAMTVLGKTFGAVGFWHGLFAGDFLSFIVTLIVCTVQNRRFPRSFEELLCLDRDFGAAAEDTFCLNIRSIEDAATASEKISVFCAEKQIDRRISYFSSLCLEEIAVNIVNHGFPEMKGKGLLELVVVNLPGEVRLIVRDNCRAFDPSEILAYESEEEKIKGIGIHLVTRLAETSYKNMYGLNIFTMSIQKG